MNNKLILILLTVFLVACGSAENGNIQNFSDLQELISAGEFEIENNWANPMGGNSINLIGNSNFIRFEGDSVDIFLPYFGVRHSGGGYGSEGGIVYKGPLEDLKIREGQEDNKIELEFEADHEGENFQFDVTIYGNGTTNTSVKSSERQSISYRGTVGNLPEDVK